MSTKRCPRQKPNTMSIATVHVLILNLWHGYCADVWSNMQAHSLAIEHSYSHCASGRSHACNKAPLASLGVPPSKKWCQQLLNSAHNKTWLIWMLQIVMKYAALVEIVFSLHISAAVSLSINSAPVPADSPLKLLSESFYLNYFHLKTLSLLNCHVVSEANISQLLKIKPSAWWDTIRGIFV